jgi:hypothetical protein
MIRNILFVIICVMTTSLYSSQTPTSPRRAMSPILLAVQPLCIVHQDDITPDEVEKTIKNTTALLALKGICMAESNDSDRRTRLKAVRLDKGLPSASYAYWYGEDVSLSSVIEDQEKSSVDPIQESREINIKTTQAIKIVRQKTK